MTFLMMPRPYVLACLALCLCAPVYCQLDPTFGDGGLTIVAAQDRPPIGSFLLPDGKLLIVDGAFQAYEFRRFNADGTPDNTYGQNGVAALSIPLNTDGSLVKAIRQADGKIVLVGRDNSDSLMVRCYEDGTLDNSFSGDGIVRPNINQLDSDRLTDVVQLADGRLVGVGSVGMNFQNMYFVIAYQSNGEIDMSFGDRGGFIIHTTSLELIDLTIAAQSTGKFLIFAGNTPGNSIPGAVYRLTANGMADDSFTPLSLPEDSIVLRVLSDDRFVVAGMVTATDNLFRTNLDITIRRFTSDGQPDISFGTGGVTSFDVTSKLTDRVLDLVDEPDGKLIVCAKTQVGDNRSRTRGSQISLIKLDAAGTVEGKYLAAEIEATGGFGIGDVLLQPDGKIVTVSTHYYEDFQFDLLLTRSVGVPLSEYRFHGVPFQFQYSDEGRSVASIFRPSEQKWYLLPFALNSVTFGLPDDVLVPSDYLGRTFEYRPFDSEVAVFRPSNGYWFIGRSEGAPPAQNFVAVQWGTQGDIPAPADYDGDGKSDLAVFRPSTGIWYLHSIADGSSRALQWGLEGDKPVPGDYDGDGIYEVAVWRPSDGFWYIIRSSDGQPTYVPFGVEGDVPVQEDYDGDGKFDVAVFRPSNGFWYILRSSDGGITYTNWGLSTDVPVPGDYDGDHLTDVAVWRPSSHVWYINYSSGQPTNPFPFGIDGDKAIPARY